MPAKKAPKKSPAKAARKKKANTVSVRMDDEMRAFLDKRSRGESYAIVIRQLIRDEQEREAREGIQE